ncbi:MAG: hypothetical protein MZU84_01710 [Sphingobacterium sp.]|nr:hypothetical protein [Sphingobacterium sp.]
MHGRFPRGRAGLEAHRATRSCTGDVDGPDDPAPERRGRRPVPAARWWPPPASTSPSPRTCSRRRLAPLFGRLVLSERGLGDDPGRAAASRSSTRVAAAARGSTKRP